MTAKTARGRFAEVRHARITHEETCRLSRLWREHNDEKALQTLIRAHQAFAIHMAKKFYRNHLDNDDVNSEAVLGLCEGARRFDPDKGVKFITYAQFWIRAFLLKQAQDSASIVRRVKSGAGAEKMQLVAAYMKAHPGFNHSHDIAQATGVSEEGVINVLMHMSPKDLHLDAPRRADEKKSESVADTFAADGPLPDEQVDQKMIALKVRDAITHKLNPRQREIVLRRFFEARKENETLQEIGDSWGVTREWVRQTEQRTLGVLKKALAKSVA